MKSFLLCIFLSLSLSLQAQFRQIKKIGIEDGLSNSFITGITQDKEGFLWFATESGLNRFDGESFMVYKKGNSDSSNSVSANEQNAVYADQYENKIWLATQREGLNSFDCETGEFKHYRNDPSDSTSLPTNDVTNITNSRDGNLWITTYRNGFAYLDKKTEQFTRYNQSTLPGLASNTIWTIAEELNGTICIGHENNGFSIFDRTTRKIKNFQNIPGDPTSLPGNKVNDIFIDRDSNIWLGTDGGLALFNKKTEKFTVFRHKAGDDNSLLSNFIFSITQTKDGQLWFGTENGGISILNTTKFVSITSEETQFINITPGYNINSLSNKTVRRIFEDRFENIWIGTYGGGINVISHQAPFFSNWTYSPNPEVTNRLSNAVACGICSDEKGRIWVGTDGGGIDIFENGEKIRSINKSNSGLTDNAVLAAFRDSRNNLWFGTWAGGVSIRKSNSTKVEAFPIENIGDVRCFSEDSQGRILIGGSNRLFRYDPNTKEIAAFTQENSGLNDDFVRSICNTANGQVWVGYFGAGISVYNERLELIRNFNTSTGLPSNMIDALYCDQAGNVWAGSGEGLIHFNNEDPTNFTVYSDNSQLADSHIRAITEDFSGKLWCSTTSGILCYDQQTKQFYNYLHKHYDEIPIGAFMAGSVLNFNNDWIMFGSQNGLCFFDPKRLPSQLTLPSVVLTDFKVYNKRLELSDQESSIQVTPNIELSHEQNTFKISFNVLDYVLTDLVEYSYQLDGLEERWYNADDSHSVTFRNIPYGSYRFKIKSRIRNQEGSDLISSWNIYIHPPFWLSWWAKTIYAHIIIIIIWLILRFYKNRLELENSLILEKNNHLKDQELHTERLRFFTNIAHELRTPLTLILGPLEDLITDTNLDSRQTGKLTAIQKSTKRLLNLINQLMEFRKTETQNKQLTVSQGMLDQFVLEIGQKYQDFNNNKQLTIDVDIAKGDYNMYFDPEVVTIIMDNLISNARKFTESGLINIALRNFKENGNEFTEITVEDSGIGIQPEALPRIFDRYYQEKKSAQRSGTGIGLALVKNLVALHEAEIKVESEPGRGTTFHLILSKENEYPDALHEIIGKRREIAEEQLVIEGIAADEKPPEMPQQANEPAQKSNQIILVVEDNKDINRYIVESLTDYYKVITAFNGVSGLEKAREHTPDLIVSDVMMPEMDGFELMGKLKADIRTSHIPVILLTAKDSIDDKTTGYELGAESYITKPFTAKLLRSRITNLLEIRKKIAEQFKESVDKKSFMDESLNNVDREFIETIAKLIEDNLDSADLDVNFLAARMAMSHSSLYRKVKALTEQTVNEYIRTIRIRKAEELLLTGRYSISEVSYMIGMSSSNYFRKCFKEEFGETPSEYLKKIASENT
ncbi:two-component regulator propeller domain-containing protein [Mangrovibacterium lignilyticum]|uniref:two-component regulator propeller domain-containing protein n=1 Tax=Mangrovibacterium lignilyticum TaxID=2668052 RepID=UPI0013D32B0A|nr:two-component regulator propeller domain-containing protein [Mangrovibacterium lignilyticum]